MKLGGLGICLNHDLLDLKITMIKKKSRKSYNQANHGSDNIRRY